MSHISRGEIVNTELVLTVLEKSAETCSIIDLFINKSVCSKFATGLIKLEQYCILTYERRPYVLSSCVGCPYCLTAMLLGYCA
jgi:hypothetical protein